VVVTTAVETSEAFDKRREALEAGLLMEVRVITRSELVGLILTHVSLDGAT
jgi:hypothetical protein